MVNRFRDGARFAEVGVYAGCSLAYLGTEIVNSGKSMILVGIDNFGFISKEDVRKNLEPIYAEKSQLTLVLQQGNSPELAATYPDSYFDFVFIDANHTYEAMAIDIPAWLPKVKKFGILAGHDVGNDKYRPYPGVLQAVREFLGEDIIIIESEDVWVKEV